MKSGDKVRTLKGCRIAGAGGVLEVIEVGLKWNDFDAARCKKEDGRIRLYLVHNLIPYNYNIVEGE